MAYADYDYYINIYKGGSVPADKFDYLAERASDFMDTITFDRLKSQDISQYEEKIKKCCCALTERIYQYNKPFQIAESGSGIKLSEKIGEYSVTNANPYDYIEKYSSEQFAKLMKSTAVQYLGNTGLMYRGID